MACRRFNIPLLRAAVLVAALVPLPLSAACYQAGWSGEGPRFLAQGAEVHDRLTGLIWKRCSLGLDWDAAANECTGELRRLTHDEALAAAKDQAEAEGQAWRVPDGGELESLVDPDCGSPVVDQSIFPDIRPNEEGLARYWTTSPVGMLDLFYVFDFIDGTPDGNSRGIFLFVRLVRSGR